MRWRRALAIRWFHRGLGSQLAVKEIDVTFGVPGVSGIVRDDTDGGAQLVER
jgi:hypothetical protein